MKKNYKIIILGAGGFISGHVENLLQKSNVRLLSLPRKKIDLKKYRQSLPRYDCNEFIYGKIKKIKQI